VSIQDRYAGAVLQVQERSAEIIQSLTENVQKAFGQPFKPLGLSDPHAVVDQLFDFWETTLRTQRELAHRVVGVGATVGDAVRSQTESVTQAVRSQTESVTQAVREQAESAKQEAHQQAAEKYEEMTKAELQEELARRDLPKSGTVEELRERLIADDQQ
jgi:SAP domain